MTDLFRLLVVLMLCSVGIMHVIWFLAAWTPVDILAAKEIRQVRADGIEAFERPRDPVILPRPTCQVCHLYVWQDGTWIELDPATHAPEGAAP